jgi:hypothetical protein
MGSLASSAGIAYRSIGPPHEQNTEVRASETAPVAASTNIGKSSHSASTPQIELLAHVAVALDSKPKVAPKSFAVQSSRVIVVPRRGYGPAPWLRSSDDGLGLWAKIGGQTPGGSLVPAGV